MNKCERGHYYDENKFSKCPVCDEDMNKKKYCIPGMYIRNRCRKKVSYTRRS